MPQESKNQPVKPDPKQKPKPAPVFTDYASI